MSISSRRTFLKTAASVAAGVALEKLVTDGTPVPVVASYGEHEKRTGQRDANWPDWYAAYMVAEQAVEELPS